MNGGFKSAYVYFEDEKHIADILLSIAGRLILAVNPCGGLENK